MQATHYRRLRRAFLVAGLVAGLAALAFPVTAGAGQNAMVTLTASPGEGCVQAIAEVTTAYAVKPSATYTYSTCAFQANLTEPAASALAADPRVAWVTPDGGTAV